MKILYQFGLLSAIAKSICQFHDCRSYWYNWIKIYIFEALLYNILYNKVNNASRGAAARSVTVKPAGCGFDPHSRKLDIYLYLYFHFFALASGQSAALNSANQHAMPPELGTKWGTEYLDTRPSTYPAVCGIQRKADIFMCFYFF